MQQNLPYLNCIEFFSGIGGYHFSLNNSKLQGEIKASYDTNQIANKVYENCFSLKPNNRVINVLDEKELDRLGCNCWLMSPPCQPYTRGGKQLDHEDPRTAALLNLIKILPKLKNPPEFIMLENVVNFEISHSRDLLINQLSSMNYHFLEFVLSPIQINIPNERPRYFLMARLLPFTPRLSGFVGKFISEWPEKTSDNTCTTPLNTVLGNPSNNHDEYLVPEKWILKSHNFRFDIVNETHSRSSCFTKAYGSHHIFGSGSLIPTATTDDSIDFTQSSTLLPLKLRFMSPKEVSLLMGFPLKDTPDQVHWIPKQSDYFLEFPKDVTISQQYRLLGNSLNVSLVTQLMNWFWQEELTE